jgi:hypothetical protein
MAGLFERDGPWPPAPLWSRFWPPLLSWLVLAPTLFGLLVALLLGVLSAFGGFLVLFGLVVVPVAAVLVLVAAVLGGRAPVRAALFATLTGVLLLGPVCMIGDAADQLGADDLGGWAFLTVLLYAIPIVAAAALTTFFAVRAWPDLARQRRRLAAHALLRDLAARGEDGFEGLAARSHLDELAVPEVLDELIALGRADVVVDPVSRRAFTRAAFLAKEQALDPLLAERGKAALYDVGQALGLSEGRVREVLYAALRNGRFSGYVDWRRGVVYGADGRRLREGRACPSCGAAMDLAGRGVVACTYCETEVMLA